MKTLKAIAIRLALSLPLLFLVLLVPFAYAAASPPAPTLVSGPFTSQATVTSTNTVFGITFLAEAITIQISPSTPPPPIVDPPGISGTCTGTAEQLIFQDGSTVFYVTCTFAGTALGSAPGTATVSLFGQGTVTGNQAFRGNFAIDHGTSGLTGIVGAGTFSGAFTFTSTLLSGSIAASGTYTAHIQLPTSTTSTTTTTTTSSTTHTSSTSSTSSTTTTTSTIVQ